MLSSGVHAFAQAPDGRRLILRLPAARPVATPSFTRGWQAANDHRARRNAHWGYAGKWNFHVFR